MSEAYKFLIPKKGLLIRDPNTYAFIPEQGMMLPVIGKDGRYWMRRINDGTMTVGTQPKQIIKEGNK